MDEEEIIGLNINDYPLSLSNSSGDPFHTNKATFLHFFEQQVPDIIVNEVLPNGALIIDAMGLLHQIAEHVPPTFGELCVFVLRHLMKLASRFKAVRVDFVADRYSPDSIKSSERDRRAGGVHQELQRPLSLQQKTPLLFSNYLKSSKNKETLIVFLIEQWKNLPGSELQGRMVYATQLDNCVKLSCSQDGDIIAEDVEELKSNQEEADGRLLLHAKHASDDKELNEKVVVVKSPDTDVFLLMAAFASQIPCPLFFATGSGNLARTLNVGLILEKYGEQVCTALLGIHAFTGCDSTSSFKGKGKVVPFKLMLKSSSFIELFAHLGDEWAVTEAHLHSLEEFVCRLYGQELTSVNKARLNIFKETFKTDHTLPPNKESLHLHCKRANYQAALWRRSLTAMIATPPPISFGWISNADASLTIQWTEISSGSASCGPITSCACLKTRCVGNKCRCKRAGETCTPLFCKCKDCCNTYNPTCDAQAFETIETSEDENEDLSSDSAYD